MSIYTDLVAAGVPVDNYYSDLYAEVTPDSVRLLNQYEFRHLVRVFRSNGKPWFDIPFAYDPYWIRRTEQLEQAELRRKLPNA